jgi:hypothetical protein
VVETQEAEFDRMVAPTERQAELPLVADRLDRIAVDVEFQFVEEPVVGQVPLEVERLAAQLETAQRLLPFDAGHDRAVAPAAFVLGPVARKICLAQQGPAVAFGGHPVAALDAAVPDYGTVGGFLLPAIAEMQVGAQGPLRRDRHFELDARREADGGVIVERDEVRHLLQLAQPERHRVQHLHADPAAAVLAQGCFAHLLPRRDAQHEHRAVVVDLVPAGAEERAECPVNLLLRLGPGRQRLRCHAAGTGDP